MVAAVRQREGRLHLARLTAEHPVDLMLLEEPEAPILSLIFNPSSSKLFNHRELLPLDFLEPGHYESSSLCRRYTEHLANCSIGSQSGEVRLGDDRAPPELDHIVNLLISKQLHLIIVV